MARNLLVAAVLVLTAATSATAQVPTDERTKWDADQKSERAFYEKQFTEFGFVPIEEIDAGRRSVRRLILRDPYGMLPIPGVEFEKRRDGNVTMRLQFREYRTEPVPINKAAWGQIVAGDKAMFALPEYRPAPKLAPSPIPPVCHGWMALAQASGNRAGRLWECQDSAGPKLDAVNTMIAIAMATRPECKVDRDTHWSFQKCFGEKETLDDLKLNEEFSKLVKSLYDAPGADRLSEARKALRVPGLTLGSPEWREARDAVRKVLEVRSFHKAQLFKLAQLEHRAANSSQPDKVKLRRTIRHWDQMISSWDANNIEILSGLAWASDPPVGK